ncbi:MAG: hypothetical protein ACSLFO_11735 [Acidimicrobiales bacterium]
MTDAARPWAGRTHDQLAELIRELLLAGHLIDRSGMPHLISHLGRDGMRDIAIGEWMAASPVYTKRMQRLLGFEGSSVETIFKGMQLDVGAPPEFMDFRYEVHDDHHGEFHLDHCGALMDVEPMGDDYVTTMCHDIEDPTFDATAIATNPRARVRPVHRPPRVPAGRTPHCAWTVTVDPDVDPLPVPPAATQLATSRAASLPLATPDPSLGTGDGWTDYGGPLDPDLVMERFSSATLAAIGDEVALQGHLLSRAFLVEVADRAAPADALAIGLAQAAGIAGLTTKRLAAALGVASDLDGLAAVLAVHPLFLPRTYVDLRLEAAAAALVLAVEPCPSLDEADGLTWPALLAGPGGDEILHAAVVCLLPHGRVERVDDARWTVTVHPDAPPAPQPDAVTLAEFSTGATFAFERRS